MITVNIWLSSTKFFNHRITHSYFGPLLASRENNEHIGHANLQLEITDNSPHFAYSQTVLDPLRGNATLKTIGVPVAIKKENHASLEPQLVRCNSFTLSFWPDERPKLIKEAAHLFFKVTNMKPRVKGVKPEFKTHAEDMLLEETAPEPIRITHSSLRYNQHNPLHQHQQALKQELSELHDLHNTLNLNQVKLKANSLQQEQLLQQKETLTIQHMQAMQQLQQDLQENKESQQTTQKQLSRKKTVLRYLDKLEQRDEQSNKQFLTSTKEMNRLARRQERLQKKEKKLLQSEKDMSLAYMGDAEKLQEQLLHQQQDGIEFKKQIDETTILLNGRNDAYLKALRAEYIDLCLRENKFISEKSETTVGRHPDLTLYLPAADSTTIGLDEKKILKSLEEENGQTYSFLTNNCASSVKRCLLAGIDEALQKQLEDAGLAPDFFQVKKIETCQTLKKWTKILEHHLIELNAAACRQDTTTVFTL